MKIRLLFFLLCLFIFYKSFSMVEDASESYQVAEYHDFNIPSIIYCDTDDIALHLDITGCNDGISHNNLLLQDIKKNNVSLILNELNEGLDVNASIDMWPLLHWAVKSGSDQVVKLLLSKGANPNLENDYPGFRETPLSLAVLEKRLDIAKLLLDQKANITSEIKKLAKARSPEMFKLLHQYSPTIEPKE